MSPALPPSLDAVRTRYAAAGQDHVLAFYPTLAPALQQRLLAQLDQLDVERVNRVYTHAVATEARLLAEASSSSSSSSVAASTSALDDSYEPLPASVAASVLDSPVKTASWRTTGLQAIAKSQVCVLLMAGGQGTRLGSSAPKGCFDIGLPSGKSLFQYQAERIRRLEQVALDEASVEGGERPVITWFVMTSGPTRRDTEAFFNTHSFFGLKPENVIFFEQGACFRPFPGPLIRLRSTGTRRGLFADPFAMSHGPPPLAPPYSFLPGTLPCLSDSGKILLASPSELAVAPDGNGGLYSALLKPVSSTDDRTVMSIIKQRGIEYVHCYGVDNCLVRVADPTFVGYCIAQQAECGAKVVPKTEPTESVGVVARKGGAYGVVEYTELPQSKSNLREADGQLAFRAANIANHFYTTAFLDRVPSFEAEMAFHIARKKIPTVDLTSGELVKPANPNGMKLELFVFDVFPFTQKFAVLEVERREEFSPLKNGPGSTTDNQLTSRHDLLAQQQRWLGQAGATVEGAAVGELEVGPLVTYAGEGLGALRGVVLNKAGLLEGVAEQDVTRFLA